MRRLAARRLNAYLNRIYLSHLALVVLFMFWDVAMQLNQLRTFKLERIQHAELLKKSPFEIPADFDGPALLKKAWGVMYGDEECVEVQLRFTSWVEQRVKETLWHPSQQIADTPDGCVMTVQIGDTLEIENWIRGWGADCEVLKPTTLREKIAKQVRRLAHMYGVLQPSPPKPPDEPDNDLLSTFVWRRIAMTELLSHFKNECSSMS